MVPWIKVIHIFAVISWMAGLLYLPRLFVYHAEAGPKAEIGRTFEVMEARLYRIIMQPAMIVVWITGLTLVWQMGFHKDRWFFAKFALVIVLSGFHDFLGRCRRNLAAGTSMRTPKFFRMINEVPAFLMLLIVILVVVKPF